MAEAFVDRYDCSTCLLAVGWSGIVARMRGGDGSAEGTGEEGGGGAETQSFC